MNKRLLSTLTLLFMLLSIQIGISAGSLPNNQPTNSSLDTVTISGILSIGYGDKFDATEITAFKTIYTLVTSTGQSIELGLDSSSNDLRPVLLQHDGDYITVEAAPINHNSAGHFENYSKVSLQAIVNIANMTENNLTGSLPRVAIMCKFADIPDEPLSMATMERLYGSAYPGLDHYWQELSYGAINLTGSEIRGWYTLPHPNSYYITDQYPYFKRQELAEDCTSLADADVYFPQYAGIDIFLNDVNWSFNGWFWAFSLPLTLDGVSQMWKFTFLPQDAGPTVSQAVTAHEQGHNLGLDHSWAYDDPANGIAYFLNSNHWDVMGKPGGGCALYILGSIGCIGQHTITYHKDLLGWIPANKKYIATPGTQATLVLDQLAKGPGSHYLMVQIPTSQSTRFYTIEARGLTKYDATLATTQVTDPVVLIHEIITTRPFGAPARLLDPDPDHDRDSTDPSATWVPGEIFVDSANQIKVCINSETQTGFSVTIDVGTNASCVFEALLSVKSFNTVPQSPASNELVTFTFTFNNLGGASAQNIVAHTSIPNNTTYVVNSATSTQGTITRNGNILIFNVGNVGYGNPVTLSFTTRVNPDVVEPTILRSDTNITWHSGNMAHTQFAIANGLSAYLPLVKQ